MAGGHGEQDGAGGLCGNARISIDRAAIQHHAVPLARQPGGPNGVGVGSAGFTFSDGNTATFNYTVNGITQSKTITREVFTAPGTLCQ